jgi:DNA-binding SARP family transcriptional activator
MFGQFAMTIDGRPVEWFRRRDRQIVQYLALQPTTSATRQNVIATFWPNADPQLANQSLRTACSTIRRAIARCVGYDRVHWYFASGPSLRLNTDHIAISSMAFRGHMREADSAFDEGNDQLARAHCAAASRVYRGRLLDSEGVELWFREERESFSAAAAAAAERAIEIRTRRRSGGEPDYSPVRLLFST